MSADNNKWEIAVGVPIVNSHFRFPNRWSANISAISGDTTTGDGITLSSFQTESDSSVSDLRAFIKSGDGIELLSSAGVTGTAVIDVVSGDSITTTTNVIGFSANDTVRGYGSLCPGGWYVANFTYSGNDRITITTGDTDNFAVRLYEDFKLRQDLDTDYLFNGVTYRVGIVQKNDNAGNDAHVQLDRGTMLTVGTVASTYTLSTSANTSGYTSGELSIQKDGGSTYIAVSDIFLEHCYNSVAGTEISSNGYYEFADFPAMGSVKIQTKTGTKFIAKPNQTVALFDSTGWGERVEKYEVSANFALVEIDFYNKIREFERIQRNGFVLNLHTYLDELPTCLTGYITIGNVDRTHWNLGLVNFTLSFTES